MKSRRNSFRIGRPAGIFQLFKTKFSVIYRIILVLVLFCTLTAHAVTIRGVVKNKTTDSKLANANVTIKGTSLGAVSKTDGSFVIENVSAGEIVVITSYMGFEISKKTVQLEENKSTELTIVLTPMALDVDDVVVTSTKFERTVRQVSMPLSVVKQHQIDRIMPRDVSEAVAAEPGLSVTRDGAWGTNVNIRGLSRNNIVMLIDGNRIDTANDLAAGLSMIDVNDVERIEVIKGAGSSLYGSGAIGGVVNILTTSGHYTDGFDISGNVSGGYSSANNSGQGFFAVNGSAEKWYVKFSGMTRSADDMKTPIGELENSRYSDQNMSARAGFRPFENHEILLNWQQYRGTDIGVPGANTLFPGQADVRYPRENRDLFSVEYVGRNVTPNLTKISVKYFKQDILRDVENVPHITKTVPGTPTKVMNVLQILPAATHATNGAHLQTNWLFGRHHVLAGLDAWQKDMDSFRERIIRVDVLGADNSVAKSINQVVGERPIPLSSYRSTGLFVQDEIPLWNNRLTMTIGGRYDIIQVENEQAMQPVYMIVDGVKNDTPAGQFTMWDAQLAQDNSWSGNLGLLFKATDKTDLTLTVARSFRSPYLEERYQYIDLGSVIKVGDPDLNPEQGAFADVGVRYWGDRFHFSTSVFFNQIKDMVVEEAGEYEGRAAFLKTNIGSAELYGADMSLSVRLTSSLSLFGAAAYVHGADTYLDEPLPLIPPLNGRLGLRGPLSRFFEFECAARMYGTQDRVASWEKETAGYTVFDFYLNSKMFTLGSLSNQIFFGLENIFDRSYRDHLSTNRGSIAIEPGRNISLRWRLGI